MTRDKKTKLYVPQQNETVRGREELSEVISKLSLTIFTASNLWHDLTVALIAGTSRL